VRREPGVSLLPCVILVACAWLTGLTANAEKTGDLGSLAASVERALQERRWSDILKLTEDLEVRARADDEPTASTLCRCLSRKRRGPASAVRPAGAAALPSAHGLLSPAADRSGGP